MSQHFPIHIHQINYAHTNGKHLFQGLNLSFSHNKIGLIGKNGVGKSTLLRLITSELAAQSGTIAVQANIAYLPQNLDFAVAMTVAELLGVHEKLTALSRILNGSIDSNDFTLLNDDWNIKERTQQQLQQFDLSQIALERTIDTLSGGEKTRLLLAKVFCQNANFILLDEPTNNLDIHAKQLLYQAIATWQHGIIVISHDRALLQGMDQIVELTTLGANSYGGNYENYVIQKAVEQAAQQQKLHDAKRFLQRAQTTIQQSQERLEQRRKYGRALRKEGSIDKLSANSAKGRSERTQRRLLVKEESLLEQAEQQLQHARTKIEITKTLAIELPATSVPNGKMVLELEEICFAYPHGSQDSHYLINNFNLKIMGPERIAIVGDNGGGKTTLIKLILGALQPLSGKITVGVKQVRYIDQAVALLDMKRSVLENFLHLNPDSNDKEARSHLARFLFREDAALKAAEILSGGEKLRAALACTLMAKQPPQLLILDEPTNHLDLESIAHLEEALSCYQGALLLISHDSYFIKNVRVNTLIKIPL
ncbi:ABC-F family ATP-binding cassette domain-containing protein [soil metagenome]